MEGGEDPEEYDEDFVARVLGEDEEHMTDRLRDWICEKSAERFEALKEVQCCQLMLERLRIIFEKKLVKGPGLEGNAVTEKEIVEGLTALTRDEDWSWPVRTAEMTDNILTGKDVPVAGVLKGCRAVVRFLAARLAERVKINGVKVRKADAEMDSLDVGLSYSPEEYRILVVGAGERGDDWDLVMMKENIGEVWRRSGVVGRLAGTREFSDRMQGVSLPV